MVVKDATLVRGTEKLEYYDEIEKTPSLAKAGHGSASARLYLPASWAGKRVLCLLLDEIDED